MFSTGCRTATRLPRGPTRSWRTSCTRFPSGEPGVSGDFWGSQEGCQGPFRPSLRHWKEKQQMHNPAVLLLQSYVLRVGLSLAAQGTRWQAASTPRQERSGPLPASRLLLGNLTELGHLSSTHGSRSGSTAESGRTGWILGVGMPVGFPRRCLQRWGRGEGSSPEKMCPVPLPSTTTAVSRPFFLLLSRSCVWHCWSRKLGRPLGPHSRSLLLPGRER